ncbi:hypothetical protein D3C72_1779110 [compost metagenome]
MSKPVYLPVKADNNPARNEGSFSENSIECLYVSTLKKSSAGAAFLLSKNSLKLYAVFLDKSAFTLLDENTFGRITSFVKESVVGV